MPYPDISIPGIPGPLIEPRDYTTTGDVTLSQRVNYFKNLTIASGHTMTGVAGGTIIVVQRTLSVVGTISVNGLGAIGGVSTAVGPGGGGLVSIGTTPTIGGVAPGAGRIQQWMANSGAGGPNNGSAWPAQVLNVPTDITLLSLILRYLTDAPSHTAVSGTYGPVGGGGGGASGVAAATGSAMSNGQPPNATNSGGSGFGGGGGGGGDAGFSPSQLAGGAGGGVILILCGILSGAGTISANGVNGGDASALAEGGGGGGGGGGAVVIAYHRAATTTPTLQATGGTGGGGKGSGQAGGNGGAGLATSFRINVGIASTI